MKVSAKGNVTIYLPGALLERCRRAAAQDGRSLSNYLTQLLERAHPPEGVVHRAPAALRKAR